VITLIVGYFLNKQNSLIKVNFIIDDEVKSEETSVGNNRDVYNYFLDYSPSMKGFFSADIQSDMHIIAEAFEEINRDNENNRFFRCADIIEPISEAKSFYGFMQTSDTLEEYYQNIVVNAPLPIETEDIESEDENTVVSNRIDEVIDKIDLSKIFTENVTKEGDSDTGSVNVIISDLNFLKNVDDLENHNLKLGTLARYLAQEVADSNIGIYAFSTNYVGFQNDEDFRVESTNSLSAVFYLIIFSDNNNAFKRYCEQLENIMANRGVQYTGKFELQDELYHSDEGLKFDLETYKSLALIENENINFANGLFKELKANELAIQLVSGNGQGMLNMPVSEVNFPGYYLMNTDGYDDTKMDVEVELYYSQNGFWWVEDTYHQFEESSLIIDKSARMYNRDGTWYIRVNLDFNTSPVVPQPDSWGQQLLNNFNRMYLVLNLKLYMVEPSFSKPEWVDTIGDLQGYDENMLYINTIIDELIHSKERAYLIKDQEDRYIGNVVLYVLY